MDSRESTSNVDEDEQKSTTSFKKVLSSVVRRVSTMRRPSAKPQPIATATARGGEYDMKAIPQAFPVFTDVDSDLLYGSSDMGNFEMSMADDVMSIPKASMNITPDARALMAGSYELTSRGSNLSNISSVKYNETGPSPIAPRGSLLPKPPRAGSAKDTELLKEVDEAPRRSSLNSNAMILQGTVKRNSTLGGAEIVYGSGGDALRSNAKIVHGKGGVPRRTSAIVVHGTAERRPSALQTGKIIQGMAMDDVPRRPSALGGGKQLAGDGRRPSSMNVSHMSPIALAAAEIPARPSSMNVSAMGAAGGLRIVQPELMNNNGYTPRISSLNSVDSRGSSKMVPGFVPTELAQPPSRSRVNSSASTMIPPNTPLFRMAADQSDVALAAHHRKLTPPVAPADRRRSGMPDAFAIPLEEIALLTTGQGGDAFTIAHAEEIRGDPKFEPYRDMLREGASEVEVAEAMSFFGVNPIEFFGKDVLGASRSAQQKPTPAPPHSKTDASANVFASAIASAVPGRLQRDRDENPSWIERKIQQDKEKIERERQKIRDAEAQAQAEELVRQEQNKRLSSTSQPQRQTEEESEAYRELRRTQQKMREEEERRLAKAMATLEAQDREYQRMKEEEEARQKEAERLAKLEEDRNAAEALARYQDQQRKREAEEREAEEARKRAEAEKVELLRAQEEERLRQAKAEEERGRQAKAEDERQRQIREEEERIQHREDEARRLKALEERIEKERAKAPPVIPPTRQQQESTTSPAIPPTRASSNASNAVAPDNTSNAFAHVASEIEGTLLKKTKGGQWHTRTFFLREKELSWLRSDQKTFNRLVLTKESQVRDVAVGLKKFMFELTVPSNPPLMLSAAGATEKVEWIRALQFAIDGTLPASSGPEPQRGSLSQLQKGKVGAVQNVNADKIMLGLTKGINTPGTNSNSVTSTLLKSQAANDKLNEKLSKFTATKPQVSCASCGETVYKMEEVALKQQLVLHRRCFICAHCKRQLTLANFVQHEGKVYCQTHYSEFFGVDSEQQQLQQRAATSNVTPKANNRKSAALIVGAGPAMSPETRPKTDSMGGASPAVTQGKHISVIQPKLVSLLPKGSFRRAAGSNGAAALSVSREASKEPAEIDNSAALSKPVVPAGRRRAPSMHPTQLARQQQQLSMQPESQDRMTSDFTFKVLLDPSNTANVIWMHASSRFERDKWVSCLCNVIQALEMRRLLSEAQKVDMMSAVQCQAELEDFLSYNQTSYSGFCEKLSIRSHRNWKRRWFDLSDKGELKYSGDDKSKKPKHVMQLTPRSVVLDARDTRLSGPLAVKS